MLLKLTERNMRRRAMMMTRLNSKKNSLLHKDRWCWRSSLWSSRLLFSFVWQKLIFPSSNRSRIQRQKLGGKKKKSSARFIPSPKKTLLKRLRISFNAFFQSLISFLTFISITESSDIPYDEVPITKWNAWEIDIFDNHDDFTVFSPLLEKFLLFCLLNFYSRKTEKIKLKHQEAQNNYKKLS